MSKHSKHPLIIDVETISYEGNLQTMEDFKLSTLPTKEEAIANWTPPGNVTKEETIERKRQEFIEQIDTLREMELEKWRSRRALQPGENQIICIAIQDPFEETGVAMASDNEADVLGFFVDYLHSIAPQSPRFIGFNINFDLTTIMFAMHRHGFSIPRPVGKWDKLDLFYEFGRSGGLKAWATRAGCELSGVDGSKVAELYESKDWQTIHDYALEDVASTTTLFHVWSTLNEF